MEIKDSGDGSKAVIVTQAVYKYENIMKREAELEEAQRTGRHPKDLQERLRPYDEAIQQVRELRAQNEKLQKAALNFNIQRADDEFEHAMEILEAQSREPDISEL